MYHLLVWSKFILLIHGSPFPSSRVLLIACFRTNSYVWVFIEVWMTQSPITAPRFFKIFSGILWVLWSGWSQFFWFPFLPVSFPNYRERSKGTNYNTAIFLFHTLFSSFTRSLAIFSLLFSQNISPKQQNPQEGEYYYHYYYLLIRVFPISVSWWFFTGVWVIASLLKSPGLVSGSWPFLAMLSFGESTRPPTSKSSRPFNKHLVIIPKAPITIGTIVTFMFHSFFNFLARSRYLSFFSYSFIYILWSAGTAKSTMPFFFSWSLWGLVFWPRLDDQFVCSSPIGVYACHFLGQVLGCAYTIC